MPFTIYKSGIFSVCAPPQLSQLSGRILFTSPIFLHNDLYVMARALLLGVGHNELGGTNGKDPKSDC